MVKFKFQFIVSDEARPNKRCHSEPVGTLAWESPPTRGKTTQFGVRRPSGIATPVCGLVRNDISIGMLNPNFGNKKDAGARVLLYQSKKSFRTSLNFLRLGVSPRPSSSCRSSSFCSRVSLVGVSTTTVKR